MTQRWFTRPCAIALGAACLLPGCTLESRDDGAEYRDAVPQREAIVLAGPETDDGEALGASTASLTATARRAQATAPGGGANYAKWYGFTRAVRAGVNRVTAQVLGSVWLIVHTAPSAVEGGEATWGPYTDALEPVTYRFRVTRVAEGEYRYGLEGRRKSSTAEDDFRAVLSGHGYGKGHEQHGEGDFTIDLDVARELDPFEHAQDSGSVQIAYQLPRDLAGGDARPRRIRAEVTPDPKIDPESFTVTSNVEEDGAGSLLVDANADVDDAKMTQREDVSVASRWRADGAGRADVVIAGGDIPADPGVVSAVECWRADFARSYYRDSVSFAPTEGEASACVYDAP